MLKTYRCDYVQGYGVCRPTTAQGVIDWRLDSDYQGQQFVA